MYSSCSRTDHRSSPTTDGDIVYVTEVSKQYTLDRAMASHVIPLADLPPRDDAPFVQLVDGTAVPGVARMIQDGMAEIEIPGEERSFIIDAGVIQDFRRRWRELEDRSARNYASQQYPVLSNTIPHRPPKTDTHLRTETIDQMGVTRRTAILTDDHAEGIGCRETDRSRSPSRGRGTLVGGSGRSQCRRVADRQAGCDFSQC